MDNLTSEEKVLKYYVANLKLKELIRTGWKIWHVSRERLESVAEHIYGTEQLAIAMIRVYGYDVDLQKIVCMLSVHELGEIIIGDIPYASGISKAKKKAIELEAVKEIVFDLGFDSDIFDLYVEFDNAETFDAKFTHWCDKLECDLMSKYYDEEDTVDLTKQDDNNAFKDEAVQKYLNEGMSWSNMWMRIGQDIYGYDENFMNVSKYAMENGLKRFRRD